MGHGSSSCFAPIKPPEGVKGPYLPLFLSFSSTGPTQSPISVAQSLAIDSSPCPINPVLEEAMDWPPELSQTTDTSELLCAGTHYHQE